MQYNTWSCNNLFTQGRLINTGNTEQKSQQQIPEDNNHFELDNLDVFETITEASY